MKSFLTAYSKILMVVIVVAAIAVSVGFTLNDQEPVTMKSTEDMDHAIMMSTYEIPEGIPVPSVVDLEVTKDNKTGWNVHFDTTNFTFTPENASTEHIENQGHAHLHIDGVKVNRLYSNNYYVADLEPGAHTFSVYLNTNDHKEYVVDGSGTGAEMVVTQEIIE